VFDPCWLDQTPRWSCDDVARRPRTPPVAPHALGTPCGSRRARQAGPRVRIRLPPALSHVRTRLPRSVGRLASTCGYHCPLGGSGLHMRAPIWPTRSGESVSLPHPLSKVENPGFPRCCARLAWRPGRRAQSGVRFAERGSGCAEPAILGATDCPFFKGPAGASISRSRRASSAPAPSRPICGPCGAPISQTIRHQSTALMA
jgi:hypothetical protein